MNRRTIRISLLLALLLGVAIVVAYPRLYACYWKWRTQLREIPLAGATVSYRDYGEGRPAVVIISGMSVLKDSYLGLQRRLGRKTRVISYDRPGIGDSTPNSEPRTLDYIDKDLKALLQALNVPPPYVLIGHSLGGHIIRYYAVRHPGEVAGLVFLDAPHEDWFDYVRKTWSKEDADAYFRWWTPTNKDYAGTRLEEMLAYETNCAMIRGIKIPPDIPVLMFTASNYGHFRKSAAGLAEDRRNWAGLQTSLLTDVKHKKHLVDMEFSHWLHQEKPDWVAGEIGAFIDKIRGARQQRPDPVSQGLLSPGSATAAPATASP